MVKTRNQADDDEGDTFVSLTGRQTRRHNYNVDINVSGKIHFGFDIEFRSMENYCTGHIDSMKTRI